MYYQWIVYDAGCIGALLITIGQRSCARELGGLALVYFLFLYIDISIIPFPKKSILDKNALMH